MRVRDIIKFIKQCKHRNMQSSMYNTDNYHYFAMCTDCKQEIIINPKRYEYRHDETEGTL